MSERVARANGEVKLVGLLVGRENTFPAPFLDRVSRDGARQGVSAELALRATSGPITTTVEVSGATFSGQDTSAAARALTKEQASDASSQLYSAFCGVGVATGRPGRSQ
jgi:hypothetical protein